MTAKECIIEQHGMFTPEEIAENIGVTVYYVNKVIKAHTANLRPSLTLQNYVAAHHQGITRKCDLARYFGVTRDAIYKFEHKPEIKSILEKYKNIVGIDPIKRLEHEMSEILSVLIECEPKSKTASTIKQLLKAIHDKKNTINHYGESSANC